MINENLFWESSIEELKKGYVYNSKNEEYICTVCGKSYQQGVIYSKDEILMDALFAVKNHIEKRHGSPFHYLLSLDKRYNGLTDIQKSVMVGMFENLDDSQIAKKLDNKAHSTIRNHRFSLREKYKEAKIFIACMELIEERSTETTKFIHFHKDIPVNDDRIVVTEKEKEFLLNKYFEDDFIRLKKFPKKQKEKLVILQQVIKNFEVDRQYTEKEVNEILKKVDSDYVTIRRYLIDYMFLDRKSDCSAYWVKN